MYSTDSTWFHFKLDLFNTTTITIKIIINNAFFFSAVEATEVITLEMIVDQLFFTSFGLLVSFFHICSLVHFFTHVRRAVALYPLFSLFARLPLARSTAGISIQLTN
jgi:hypothetical protein